MQGRFGNTYTRFGYTVEKPQPVFLPQSTVRSIKNCLDTNQLQDLDFKIKKVLETNSDLDMKITKVLETNSDLDLKIMKVQETNRNLDLKIMKVVDLLETGKNRKN